MNPKPGKKNLRRRESAYDENKDTYEASSESIPHDSNEPSRNSESGEILKGCSENEVNIISSNGFNGNGDQTGASENIEVAITNTMKNISDELSTDTNLETVKPDKPDTTVNNTRCPTPPDKISAIQKPDGSKSNVDDNVTNAPAEMEPLVLEEETEPELQFDESSDHGSGKSSPALTRCVTRRSQTRNIPTPKTPKSPPSEQNDDLEKTSEISESQATNNTESDFPEMDTSDIGVVESNIESTHDISTKVTVGSESSRLNFTISEGFSSSFLHVSKGLAVGETLRGLSSRRSIRPIGEGSFNFIGSDVDLRRHQRHSVESIASVKRKQRSDTPQEYEQVKKLKPSSPGLLSYVRSPINSLINRFGEIHPLASTPKLTCFKTKDSALETADVSNIAMDEIVQDAPTKKWCVIM